MSNLLIEDLQRFCVHTSPLHQLGFLSRSKVFQAYLAYLLKANRLEKTIQVNSTVLFGVPIGR